MLLFGKSCRFKHPVLGYFGMSFEEFAEKLAESLVMMRQREKGRIYARKAKKK